MKQLLAVTALTLMFAACSTTPDPPSSQPPTVIEQPTLSEADRDSLVTSAQTEFTDAPSDAEVADTLKELEGALTNPADDPDFAVETPTPEDGSAIAPQAARSRLAFVNYMIQTPLDNFWAIRQNPNYRKGWYAWFNWNTDGCSGYTKWFKPSAFLKKMLDVVWFKACVQHDFAYRNYKKVFNISNIKTQAPKYKALADQRFLDGMNWTCDRTFDRFVEKPLKALCRKGAVYVIGFVRRFGT